MATVTPHTITKQLQQDVEIRGQMAAKREEDIKNRSLRAEQIVQDASTTVMNSLSQPLPDHRISKIEQLHSSIIMGIEHTNEDTLLSSFRQRLLQVQTDQQNTQDRQIMKETNGSKTLHEYLERIRILETALNTNQERYNKLEKQCTALTRENTRLKNQYRYYEKDRENLLQQLTDAQRNIGVLENKIVLLNTEITAVKGELDDVRIAQQNDRMNRMNKDTNTTTNKNSSNSAPRLSDEEILHYADSISFGSEPALTGHTDPSRGSVLPSGLRVMDEAKYREVISRLKRMFDAEYRQCKAARTALSNELQHRTEGEHLLRTAIAEARAELGRKRTTLKEDVKDYAAINEKLTKGNTGNTNTKNHHGSPSSQQRSPTRTTQNTPKNTYAKGGLYVNTALPAAASSFSSSSSSRSRSYSSSSSVSSSSATSVTDAGEHSSFTYDEVKVMSRDERQALLIQLLCQESVLNALPSVIFPSRDNDGTGGSNNATTGTSGSTKGETK